MDRVDPTIRRPLSCALLGLMVWAAGCRGAPPVHRVEAAPRWPVLLGDGSATVNALLGGAETGVVAGEAPHGLTVRGRTLSDVPGGYVLGLDGEGAAQWVRTLEGEDGVRVDALAAAGSAVVFAGYFEGHVRSGSFELRSAGASDCLVGRVGPEGGLLWLERWGTAGGELCRAIATVGNRVWVAGSRPDPDRVGFSDVLLLELDATTGALLSERAFTGGGDDHGRALAVNDRGQLAVGGMYGGPYDARGAVVVPEPNTALGWGQLPVRPPAADYDAFVVVLDPDGSVAATGGWSSPGFDTVKDLAAADVAPDGGWVAAGVHQPGLVAADGPGLAADQVPLGGIVLGLSPRAEERWRFAESALSSASAVVVERDTIWVVGHARGPMGDALRRGPRGPSAAIVLGLGPGGLLNRVAGVCDGVAVDQGHALSSGGGGGALWWAGAVSAGADCLQGGRAQAGVVFRLSSTPP